MLFGDELVSYDNAQRQLKGIRRFLLECERDNYKETGVVKSTQLDLTINKGEKVSLIGPNGCGKSTILSVLHTHPFAE